MNELKWQLLAYLPAWPGQSDMAFGQCRCPGVASHPERTPPIEQRFVRVEDGVLPLEVEVVLENAGEEDGPTHE